ncbi:MAG: MaoC family dehydratase [Roseovarius sp.]|nr:MaoC family dehydratase [Roseovarius sp.]MCY4291519.1 MaoC family dehydratase [Roseovarius sp.]
MKPAKRQPLKPGLYGLSGLSEGDYFETPSHTVTAEDIDGFAALGGDRFAIHMSDETARSHGFAGRVAHGLLVLSIIDGLKNQSEAQLDAIASLGWNIGFSSPVQIGDTIQSTITIAELRKTSKPDRGIATLDVSATNQNGAVVQNGQNMLMIKT